MDGAAGWGGMPPPARGCLRSEGRARKGRRGSPVPPRPAGAQAPGADGEAPSVDGGNAKAIYFNDTFASVQTLVKKEFYRVRACLAF